SFVGVDDDVALATGDGHGGDLLGDQFVGSACALVRGGGHFVLFVTRDAEGGVVALGGGYHGVFVEGIRQSVVCGQVDRGDTAVCPALARAGQQVRGVGHGFLAADGDDLGFAGADESGTVDDGGEAGEAQLVDGGGGHIPADACTDRRLAGGALAVARCGHVAHDYDVDLARL